MKQTTDSPDTHEVNAEGDQFDRGLAHLAKSLRELHELLEDLRPVVPEPAPSAKLRGLFEDYTTALSECEAILRQARPGLRRAVELRDEEFARAARPGFGKRDDELMIERREAIDA